jgi:hypothetical protein
MIGAIATPLKRPRSGSPTLRPFTAGSVRHRFRQAPLWVRPRFPFSSAPHAVAALREEIRRGNGADPGAGQPAAEAAAGDPPRRARCPRRGDEGCGRTSRGGRSAMGRHAWLPRCLRRRRGRTHSRPERGKSPNAGRPSSTGTRPNAESVPPRRSPRPPPRRRAATNPAPRNGPIERDWMSDGGPTPAGNPATQCLYLRVRRAVFRRSPTATSTLAPRAPPRISVGGGAVP